MSVRQPEGVTTIETVRRYLIAGCYLGIDVDDALDV
jgi:hypothetical protein